MISYPVTPTPMISEMTSDVLIAPASQRQNTTRGITPALTRMSVATNVAPIVRTAIAARRAGHRARPACQHRARNPRHHDREDGADAVRIDEGDHERARERSEVHAGREPTVDADYRQRTRGVCE